MLSRVRRLIGSVSVVQKEKEIVISGIPADVMTRDITRLWKTTRINIHMFTTASRNTLAFPLFFAPDVAYMLGELIEFRSRQVSARILVRIRDKLLSETWLADTVRTTDKRLDWSRLRNMAWTPKSFQEQYLKFYDDVVPRYHLTGNLLAGAAGSGKTFTGLCLAELLAADTVLIVCPKTATETVWEANINNVFKKQQTYWIYQHGKPYNNERFVVLHYEALETILRMVKQFKRGKVVVILDESHNLNEITAQRTQYFIELCKQLESQDVIWASGTPIKALGGESIPLLSTIDPYFTEEVQQCFKKIFGRDGNRGVDILRQRMGLVSFKIEKSELGLDKPVMKSLPVKIPNGSDYTLSALRQVMTEFIRERAVYYAKRRKEDEAYYERCLSLHEATLKTKQQKELFDQYRRLVKLIQKTPDVRQLGDEIQTCNRYELKTIVPTLPKDDRNTFKDVRSIIKYVELKIQGECLGRVLGRKRIQCHVDMVPYVDWKGVCESTDKKTVVFTSFVPALEACDKHLRSEGMKPAIVYGKTNNELRQTVQRFGRDEDLNPLVATYNSLSTAVPLIMADTMILLNSPFRAYVHEQAISRIHRLGAETQTHVWSAYLDTGDVPNISTRSSDILKWSQEQVEQIMGIKSPFSVADSADGVTVSAEGFGLEERVSIEEVIRPKTKAPAYTDW